MPTFQNTRRRGAPSVKHPVSDVLSRYLAMTAPARRRASVLAPAPRSSDALRAERSAGSRAEELWDALGDFA